MSDLCHCARPVVIDRACVKCGLWFNEEEWRRDLRVLRALEFESDIDSTVDEIMKVSKNGR